MAKAILFVVFTVLFANTVSAANSNVATKGDLKQMLEYLDKRFEQIDKRFEQVDKRFEDQRSFMLTIISIFSAIIAAMFYYMVSRFNQHEQRMAQLIDKPASIEKIIFAVRTDSTLRRELREALKVH